MTTEVKSQRTLNGMTWWIVMGALVVIGAIAWIVQLVKGMSVLGIGQIIPWGLYIAAFFTIVGVASGLLFLAVLSELDVIQGLKVSVRKLLIAALACYIAGGFMILMDIGKPERVLNMLFKAQFVSPFVWDFFSLALGVIMTLVLLFVAKKPKWLLVLAAIVAGLVVVFEGWILGMSAGSPLWTGGMMPAVFLVEALLAALAVTVIAKPAAKDLQRWMLVLLPILFLLNLFEFGASLYAGTLEEVAGTKLILASPLFWFMLVLGVILPFVLLMWVGNNRNAVISAAVLVILGVLAAKSIMLVAGQSISFLMGTSTYTPSLVEFAGVIGVVGLAGLLYLLGTRFLPKKA